MLHPIALAQPSGAAAAADGGNAYTGNLSGGVLCACWVENPFGGKGVHWTPF